MNRDLTRWTMGYPIQFNTGNLIKLSIKNLRLKNKKISPRQIGPFRITERIGAQAYRLALPAKYERLHNVFPIQLLEKYHPRDDGTIATMPMPDLEDPENEWEVEEIRATANLVDHRDGERRKHHLVKWTGWPAEYDSQEPVDYLANAPKIVQKFEYEHKKRKGSGDSEDKATYDKLDAQPTP